MIQQPLVKSLPHRVIGIISYKEISKTEVKHPIAIYTYGVICNITTPGETASVVAQCTKGTAGADI